MAVPRSPIPAASHRAVVRALVLARGSRPLDMEGFRALAAVARRRAGANPDSPPEPPPGEWAVRDARRAESTVAAAVRLEADAWPDAAMADLAVESHPDVRMPPPSGWGGLESATGGATPDHDEIAPPWPVSSFEWSMLLVRDGLPIRAAARLHAMSVLAAKPQERRIGVAVGAVLQGTPDGVGAAVRDVRDALEMQGELVRFEVALER